MIPDFAGADVEIIFNHEEYFFLLERSVKLSLCFM